MAILKLVNPDRGRIYHCWHYCAECKRTWTHSQGDHDEAKRRECCSRRENLITVPSTFIAVEIVV